MSGQWISVQVDLPKRIRDVEELEADYLGTLLFEIGAEGIEWRDGPPLSALAAFSMTSGAPSELGARVQAHLDDRGATGTVTAVSPYDDVDWTEHWRRHFSPLAFGPEEDPIWIVPSWLEVPAGARHALRIDPSSAFGTGLHPTTALCLEWVWSERPLELLDVGTGTGVLALAAARRGARRVAGIDNDPEAVRVAIENRALNGPEVAGVVFSGTPAAELKGRFETVVANILAGPLMTLAPALVARLAPGGTLVLSGLLPTQADEVVLAYEAEGCLPLALSVRGEWARVLLRGPE